MSEISGNLDDAGIAQEPSQSADEVELLEESREEAPASDERNGEGPSSFEERFDEMVGEAGNFMARNLSHDPEADDTDRIWGLGAYISQLIIPVVLPVLMLVLEPNKSRPFQRYHAAQSLGFLVLMGIYEILALIVFTVLTAITLGCLGAVLWLLFILPVVPAIYYAYLAYQGKRFEIPFLTGFLRGQGWL